MAVPMKTFQVLCKDLYEPLVEKVWERLHVSIDEIARKYAARRFPLPPGAMYAEIWNCYKISLPTRAEIIFNSCCQAYKASTPKPKAEEFSIEVLDAIAMEQKRILDSGVARFNQFNSRFKIPNYQTFIERFTSDLSSEGSQLFRHYSSKAIIFLGESTSEVMLNQSVLNSQNRWYQRPIGYIGLSVVGGVLVILVVYLIKQHLGLAL